jgi:hypothetical protein
MCKVSRKQNHDALATPTPSLNPRTAKKPCAKQLQGHRTAQHSTSPAKNEKQKRTERCQLHECTPRHCALHTAARLPPHCTVYATAQHGTAQQKTTQNGAGWHGKTAELSKLVIRILDDENNFINL